MTTVDLLVYSKLWSAGFRISQSGLRVDSSGDRSRIAASADPEKRARADHKKSNALQYGQTITENCIPKINL